MKGNYLITTNDWFIAPDGQQYKAVWGSVEIIDDDFLGIKTNKNSSNLFAIVGSEDKHVIVAGCQIHYAVKTEDKPNAESIKDMHANANAKNDNTGRLRPSYIYLAQ